MLSFVRKYRLPDSVKKAFADFMLTEGKDFNPYETPYNPNGTNGFHYMCANKLRSLLADIAEGSPDYKDAKAILKEFEEQRSKCGAVAFVIDNLPIDDNLPATPQSNAELPVGKKSTFISEAIHEALLFNMGQRPYSQPGMQNGHEITQVIPFPGSHHEQSNRGNGVLALHTEISPGSGIETPEIQSLVGLRGGKNIPISQTVITTLVQVERIVEQLSEEEIRVLSLPIFHFSSGPAVAENHQIERSAAVITKNRQGHYEFRLHTDPARMTIDPRRGKAASADTSEKAQAALQHLRKICDVLQNPQLNASAIRIDPGVGLFWHNKQLLHGRGDIRTLLENAIKGEKYSLKLAHELLPPDRTPQDLLDEYTREKELAAQNISGLGKDPHARWIQRMRGLSTTHPPGISI